MPTAVVQVDLDGPVESIELDPRYAEAYVVFRSRGLPVGHTALTVRDGVLGPAQLADAAAKVAAVATALVDVRAYIDEHIPRPAPAPFTATVAICTRDRADDLARCLAAIATLPDDGQEVLVIDNASRDAAAIRDVVARTPGVRLVREDRPGLDVARNRALREATGEIVAFCDDDAAVEPGWLRAIAAGFDTPRTLCVTGLVLPLELETRAQEIFEYTNGFGRGYHRRSFDGAVDDPFHVSRIGAGASMALRRSLLQLVGPFDEALDAGTATRSGGDHDMFSRILSAGYVCTYEPAAVSWHRHRREWSDLRATIRGYGTGVWSYLIKHALRGETRAVSVAVGWFVWQLGDVVRLALGRRAPLPRDLTFDQLLGCLEAPLAYRRARRASPTVVAPGELSTDLAR